MTAEQTSERESILRAAEFAPETPRGPIAADLLGWWTPQGWFVCAKDAARIFERGCKLPTKSTATWKGDVVGVCLICQH